MTTDPANPMLRAITTGNATTVPTRAEIRAYVAANVAKVKAHVSAGGNQYHLLYEQSDQVEAFARLLPDDVRGPFIDMFIEEMTAAKEGMRREAEEQELVVLSASVRDYTIVRIVGSIVIFILLSVIFRQIG